MLHRALDAARQIRRKNQWEYGQHKEEREVSRPGGGQVQHDRRLSRQMKPIEDHYEAHRRDERVDTPPAIRAHGCDGPGTHSGRRDGDRVYSEEYRESEDQCRQNRLPGIVLQLRSMTEIAGIAIEVLERVVKECPEQPVSGNSAKRTSAFHQLNGR